MVIFNINNILEDFPDKYYPGSLLFDITSIAIPDISQYNS
jgi:hypothetical protein